MREGREVTFLFCGKKCNLSLLGEGSLLYIVRHLGHSPNGPIQEWAYQDMAHSNQLNIPRKAQVGSSPATNLGR
ncbi:hypothetical protein HanPI659440_Chr08g0291761 [Helianthus annuus]|nr:hypothetical protein HanPI659440_Chr08g0291761 [Helianthus annuus]